MFLPPDIDNSVEDYASTVEQHSSVVGKSDIDPHVEETKSEESPWIEVFSKRGIAIVS
jgi:hypothetical protein